MEKYTHYEINKFTNGKNFTKIKAVFLTAPIHFGNYMIMVNTIMYYCELFSTKNILVQTQLNYIKILIYNLYFLFKKNFVRVTFFHLFLRLIFLKKFSL